MFLGYSHPGNLVFLCDSNGCSDGSGKDMDVVVSVQVVNLNSGIQENLDLSRHLPDDLSLEPSIFRVHQKLMRGSLTQEGSVRSGDKAQIRRNGLAFGEVEVNSEGDVFTLEETDTK
jgi:hypothetical protein